MRIINNVVIKNDDNKRYDWALEDLEQDSVNRDISRLSTHITEEQFNEFSTATIGSVFAIPITMGEESVELEFKKLATKTAVAFYMDSAMFSLSIVSSSALKMAVILAIPV